MMFKRLMVAVYLTYHILAIPFRSLQGIMCVSLAHAATAATYIGGYANKKDAASTLMLDASANKVIVYGDRLTGVGKSRERISTKNLENYLMTADLWHISCKSLQDNAYTQYTNPRIGAFDLWGWLTAKRK